MEMNKDYLQMLRNAHERINGKCTDEEWNKKTEEDFDHKTTGILQEEFLKSRDAYAAGFAEWIAEEDWRPTLGSINWAKWNPSSSAWIYKTTSQLLELFNK